MFKDFDFRDHPDTIEVELAGQTLPWFLGRKSFRLAKERGVEISEVLQTARSAQKNEDLNEAIDTIAKLVWTGFLVFDEELEIDAVADRMSLQDIPRLKGTIMGEFEKLKEAGDLAAGNGKAGKEGGKKAKKS